MELNTSPKINKNERTNAAGGCEEDF